MFNMLNSWIERGKNSPMVCKFLDSVSGFSHKFDRLFGGIPYLLERVGLRNGGFQPVGLRIALPIGRPAFIRMRSGKD